MNKKIAAFAAGTCTAILILAGCSSEISNDYITISQYKGVEVEKVEPQEVTDETVENRLLEIQQENAVTTEVDRAAEEGDTAIIDYVGKLDGTAFEGGTGEDYPLELGSHSFIDGFEEGIIGHNPGETFDLDLTFPEDYQNSSELAGKEVTFTVTLKSLTFTEVPEMNDEFVQSISEESKTVEEYKKEVQKDLEEMYQEAAEQEMQYALWTTVMENTTVNKYPKEELQEMADEVRDRYEQEAAGYGMELEDFLESNNMDEDSYNAEVSKTAKSWLKEELAMNLIAEKCKADLSDEALEKECEKLAEDFGFESADKFREVLKEQNNEEALERTARQNLILDWLLENSKQVEKTEDDSTKSNE